jgi:hypothetical protein
MSEEGVLSQIKRLVVGLPIPSHLAHHERLSRFTGLAVLSSDPLSSVAYATEEILRVLILVGVGALSFSSPVQATRSEECSRDDADGGHPVDHDVHWHHAPRPGLPRGPE